ncbi:DNA/RNA helicase domain-containing protein [Paenibacillus kandeliae]|uniref:DNA/RNA helicase domain-containing protein n=1 Tax=Paenibacillus kandeliae TaxID=3231269 RepID=UPI00345958E8
MQDNYTSMMGEVPSKEQVDAWDDCYIKSLPFFQLCLKYDCIIIFEYQLPREGGRRPDVLLLSGNRLFVLEYKMKSGITRADVDQVSSYARDLKHYHSASHELEVIPYLVPTKVSGKHRKYDNVIVCTPDKLAELIEPHLSVHKEIKLEDWLAGEYLPLPTLVSAAQTIYHNQDLPYIRKANSVGIPEAVTTLMDITTYAMRTGKRLLALVTGVPGAGKTLLGLDFVHKTYNGKDCRSVFLSGNGPLVEVLQHALQNKTFVSSLRSYIKEYAIHKRSVPIEHIIVFDEAQRLWDKNQVLEKHNINKSEADLIVEIAESIPDWSVMLGLVGEGQEIHNGEEAGITQWKDAIEAGNKEWLVICPPKLEPVFKDICEVITSEKLDLNVSLRSHLADDVSKFVASLLDRKISEAKHFSEIVRKQGFKMYVTRELIRAKNYCQKRYENTNIKRYGLVCSSKSFILPRFGIDNSYQTTKSLKLGQWYNEPSGSKYSCCQLNKVVTEFSCQGLELDMPIVCWGEDLLWDHDDWKQFKGKSRCKDPHQIRLNSYRVLLTRGRDGFIVYIPNDKTLDKTYELLLHVGLEKLHPSSE